jgi:hypothetical protein
MNDRARSVGASDTKREGLTKYPMYCIAVSECSPIGRSIAPHPKITPVAKLAGMLDWSSPSEKCSAEMARNKDKPIPGAKTHSALIEKTHAK